jgi:hypothetical protein
MRSQLPVRKTTYLEANDAERDREHWLKVPAAERFLHVFRMSEEAYALVGKLPAAPAGRPRSAARVLRA